jgi:hypothetical protein
MPRVNPHAYSDSSPTLLPGFPRRENALGYENLSAKQLAGRLNIPASWVRDRSRSKIDPIPHLTLGKYPRFRWDSPELNAWIEAQVACNFALPADCDRDACEYEYLDSGQLAARLDVPETWVRDQVRARAAEPIPHARFGKYVRFRWRSPELAIWAERRMVSAHNTVVSRAPRKETVQ